MLSPQYWILLASMLVPMAALLGIVWVVNSRRSLGKERPPVSEKLLRPDGESLRKELERLDERINDTLLWLFLGPALMNTVLLIQNPALKPAHSHAALGFILEVNSNRAFSESGAAGRNRTGDRQFTKLLLYQLSYSGLKRSGSNRGRLAKLPPDCNQNAWR